MSQELTVPTYSLKDAPLDFEVFGKYLLLKRLGTGGMAEVFLARPASHNGNGRVLVIKRILPHMADDPVFVNMFQAEVQTMMGFNHPHTVQLHDFGKVNKQLYIAMEFLEGKNLKQIISKFRAVNEMIPVPMALSILAQAATGLNYAHSFENKVTGEVVNAVHRDISPQNLILSYDGNLKVIDFGIAKAGTQSAQQTRTGIIKGKIAYLSPEQVHGEDLDGRSDIFSLGIVAWELLTFRRPFSEEADNELTVIHKIENCDKTVVPPSTYNKEIPKEVDALIMKALKKNPNDRYPTAGAFQNAIRQVMRQLYPNYSYADTGELVRVLFETDIAEERIELRELNATAQETLSIEKAPLPGAEEEGVITGVFNGIRSLVPNRLEKRIESVETAMRQKATTRHYLLLVIYFAGLVALKLDDRYSILDRVLGPPGAKIAQTQEFQPNRVKSATTVTTTYPAKRASR